MDFNTVLVPVVDTIAAEEAIKLACGLSLKNKGKKAKIFSVYIIAVDRTLPVDAVIESQIQKAEDILDRMEAVAGELGCEVATEVLQAREVGPAIVDEAVERRADVIVMGITYKTSFGQFTMGNVVPYVLKNAPCRVMLYQQPHASQVKPQ